MGVELLKLHGFLSSEIPLFKLVCSFLCSFEVDGEVTYHGFEEVGHYMVFDCAAKSGP